MEFIIIMPEIDPVCGMKLGLARSQHRFERSNGKERDVKRSDAPLVCIDGDGARLCRDRHTQSAGTASNEIGVCSSDCLHRADWGIPLRPGMPGTVTRSP